MRLTGSVLALCVLLMSTESIYGQKLTKEYDQCMGATDTNAGFSACSSAEIDRQEKLLSGAWSKASTAMKARAPSSHPALLREQRAWITYKDAACQFYLTGDFGSFGTVLHFGECKAQVIAERVATLLSLVEFLEL